MLANLSTRYSVQRNGRAQLWYGPCFVQMLVCEERCCFVEAFS
jgi:hypothetical protein